MTLRVSGKQVDIGDSLRTHVSGRIDEALGKYYDGSYSGHVVVEREGSGFKTDCLLHLDSGITLQASGRGLDAYQSFDQAAEHVEKRLRRYKRRIKDHRADESERASYQVLAAPAAEEEEVVEAAPVVIAESTTSIKTLTVSEAVIELDFTGAPALVFRHAVHGGINVVYRRNDGNIGWIDPQLSGNAGAA
ncbi:MAG TPA: ribosome-associated translation inhibitor RaiA [Hyphomicrobiales bacterium]|nr:ribosome-associated translation inhibitor RaiA [Kaistiaceae bacterium]HQF31189.1 ribosome-associated translation inhibitor RaiA [Hyphomicrobiales bacterium]